MRTTELDNLPCDVCGLSEDGCICTLCPVCGIAGDISCYEQHGLVRTERQVHYRELMDELIELEETEDEASI